MTDGRHHAATALAVLFGVAFLLLSFATWAAAYRNPDGLDPTAAQLLLTVGGLLTGAVGGYLARHRRRDAADSTVGVVLAVTLGLALIVACTVVVADAVTSTDPGLSDPAGNVLAALLGGALGAVGAYLGLDLDHTNDERDTMIDERDEQNSDYDRDPDELDDDTPDAGVELTDDDVNDTVTLDELDRPDGVPADADPAADTPGGMDTGR